MKTKERKALAQKIAKQEKIIRDSSDKKAIKEAEYQIMELSGRVTSLEDMVIIDEMVQDILSNS